MIIKSTQLSSLFSLTLAMLILVGFAASFTISCSSSAASAKKEKSKKKKADAEEESDEETSETHAEKGEKHDEAKEDKKPAKDGEKAKKEHSGDKADDKKKDGHGKDEKAALPDPEVVWADLIKGNKRFIAGQHTVGKLISARLELSKGQHPKVIILGCADSRVPPELLFDKNLGELFVIRAAGNVADSVALGSIEYAVEHLHASVLVVLGHESCGAVAAAVSGEKMPSKNLDSIVSKIAPAFAETDSCPIGGKPNSSCIQLNVKQSAKDVLLNSPILKEAVKEGKLNVIRAVYKLDTGEVVRLD